MYINSIDDFDRMIDSRVGHLVIEGQSGGHTYLTFPVNRLNLKFQALFLLIQDLEHLDQEFPTLSPFTLENSSGSPIYEAWIRHLVLPVPSNYQLGAILDDIWVSPNLSEKVPHLPEQVRRILIGKQMRLELGQPEKSDDPRISDRANAF